MRSPTRAWASSSDLQFFLVSTSDTIALSFGFVSTLIAIVTVFVTRRAYYIPCSYFIYFSLQIHVSTALTSFCSATARDLEQLPTPNLGSATQAQGDIVIEEMRLRGGRRWREMWIILSLAEVSGIVQNLIGLQRRFALAQGSSTKVNGIRYSRTYCASIKNYEKISLHTCEARIVPPTRTKNHCWSKWMEPSDILNECGK